MKELILRLKMLIYGKPKCERCTRLIEKNNYYRNRYVEVKSKLQNS